MIGYCKLGIQRKILVIEDSFFYFSITNFNFLMKWLEGFYGSHFLNYVFVYNA